MVSSRELGREGSARGALQAWTSCVVLPAALTLLLVLASHLGPLLGGLLGFLAPAPAIHAYLRGGRGAGWSAVALVSAALVGVAGAKVALKFLLLMAPLIVLLSEGIRLRASIERVVLAGLSPAVLLAAVALFLHWAGQGGALVALLGAETGAVLEEIARPGIAEGGEGVARFLWLSLPAIAFLNVLSVSLVNYLVIRWFWVQRRGEALFPPQDLSRWAMPEPAVWPLIACGGSLLLPWEALFWLGWNGLLVLLFGYFLQGMAILRHFFSQRGVLWAVRLPVYVLGVFFPYGVAALGLFDLWMDFRKIQGASGRRARGGEGR